MAKYLIIVSIALAIVLPLLWIAINYVDKRLRKKQKSFINTKKHYRNNFLTRSYKLFSKLPLTRTYINRLRIIYEITYPADEGMIIRRTMRLAYFIWSVCIFEIATILIMYPTYTGFINSSIIVIYSVNEIKSYIVGNNEFRFLIQFDSFLSGVRHRYYSNHLVDTAIIEAGEVAGYEMSLHAKHIERILNSEIDAFTGEEAIARETEEYNESIHNNYLKMFLSLCQYVMEYGDIKRNGIWVFLQNVSDIRNEINLEMRNIKDNNYMFQSLTIVTIVPILALYPIKRWAISNLPELDPFYNGRVGILIALFLYLITLACYVLVCSFKLTKYAEAKDHKLLERLSKIPFFKLLINHNMKKNFSKYMKRHNFLERVGESITVNQLFLKQIICSLLTFVISIGVLWGLHINERRYVLDNVRDEVATTATSKDNDIISSIVLQYANDYKNRVISELEIEEMLKAADTFSNDLTTSQVANEIFGKINTYQNEYFKWYEIIISLLLSIIAYYIPFWLILYRLKILEMTMEAEVIQFQNIIIMLMYMPNVSIKSILEQMEVFAVIFKKSIQKCLNNYPDGDLEALEELKSDEKFGPFQNLVDNFITADTIGIELAFEEIVTDRENSRERRKQDTSFNRNKRAMYATIIAFIPVVAVLVFYLIGPFLIDCYKMYQEYRSQMNSMY